MWITVCVRKSCGWDHVASSAVSAEMYASFHQFGFGWAHRAVVVDIPEPEPEPPQPPPDHPAPPVSRMSRREGHRPERWRWRHGALS